MVRIHAGEPPVWFELRSPFIDSFAGLRGGTLMPNISQNFGCGRLSCQRHSTPLFVAFAELVKCHLSVPLPTEVAPPSIRQEVTSGWATSGRNPNPRPFRRNYPSRKSGSGNAGVDSGVHFFNCAGQLSTTVIGIWAACWPCGGTDRRKRLPSEVTSHP